MRRGKWRPSHVRIASRATRRAVGELVSGRDGLGSRRVASFQRTACGVRGRASTCSLDVSPHFACALYRSNLFLPSEAQISAISPAFSRPPRPPRGRSLNCAAGGRGAASAVVRAGVLRRCSFQMVYGRVSGPVGSASLRCKRSGGSSSDSNGVPTPTNAAGSARPACCAIV